MLVFLVLQGSFILFVSIVISGMNSTYLAFESSRATAERAGERPLLNAAVECCGGEEDLEHPVGPYSVRVPIGKTNKRFRSILADFV